DPNPRMRHAVLDVYRIEDEASLKNVIPLLGDDADAIANLAREKISRSDYQNSLRLVKSLSLPQKKVREALFDLLEDMSIKDLDVFRFVQQQAIACYQLTVQAQGVRRLPEGDVQGLLAIHLDERIWFTLQTTLRVLAAQDRSNRMHRIVRGIFSDDKRQRANSLEAMDDILDRNLVRMLMPLLDDMDPDERIAAGRRLFPAEVTMLSASELFDGLLESSNWVTLALGLVLIQQSPEAPPLANQIDHLTAHTNRHVAMAAEQWINAGPNHRSPQEENMGTKASIPLTDKILHLKNIEIFSDLSINELAAVASVTEEAVFDPGEQVFKEGDRGDTLYLVLEGDVAVIKDCNLAREIELDSISAGDYFGEMALFGDDRRSATIRVKKASRFLTLNKQELQEIVREYPQIALHVCRVLSMRIRHLHGKISDQSC
ncbi:MAG: cyclic nucleotide-binding domain-containing protein, partial [Desulfosarcina sp.]